MAFNIIGGNPNEIYDFLLILLLAGGLMISMVPIFASFDSES